MVQIRVSPKNFLPNTSSSTNFKYRERENVSLKSADGRVVGVLGVAQQEEEEEEAD